MLHCDKYFKSGWGRYRPAPDVVAYNSSRKYYETLKWVKERNEWVLFKRQDWETDGVVITEYRPWSFHNQMSFYMQNPWQLSKNCRKFSQLQQQDHVLTLLRLIQKDLNQPLSIYPLFFPYPSQKTCCDPSYLHQIEIYFWCRTNRFHTLCLCVSVLWMRLQSLTFVCFPSLTSIALQCWPSLRETIHAIRTLHHKYWASTSQ